MGDENPSFSATHVIEYDYRRSVGAALGRFFSDLRDHKIIGSRGSSGRVTVPPTDYDPETGAAVDDFVEVGPSGTVTSWAWVNTPRARHPLAHPFAWALIQLEGADTGLLHAVDAGSESAMKTGLRVRPRWRAESKGEIHDIECFEPEGS